MCYIIVEGVCVIMKRFVVTMSVFELVHFIVKCVLFLISTVIFVWFVWGMFHGLPDVMADYMHKGIKLLVEVFTKYKADIIKLIVIFAVFVGGVALLFDD